MKKIMLVICLLISVAMNAQVGVNAGMNRSCLIPGEGEGLDALCCPFFALYYSYPLGNGDNTSVSAGAEMTSSGGQESISMNEGEFEYSIENKTVLNYLNLPLQFNYNLGGNKVRPFLGGGTVVGFLLSANQENKMTIGGETEESETDIKENLKGTNVSVNLGGGIGFALGGVEAKAAVSYRIGLTDISKSEENSLKTRDVVFTVGLAF